MGNNRSRVVEIANIEDHLSRCEQLGQKNCSVYGPLHLVLYNNMEVYIGQALSNSLPSESVLHYLVPPNLLIIPKFTLIEQAKPSSFDSLIDLIEGVAQIALKGQVGFGHNRIGFAGKWGIVGQKSLGWAYQQVLKNPNATGIYLSPQLVLSLSQQRLYPQHNPIKSDMFAFGIMVLQIIFQEKLTNLFDYKKYEIKLKPLLEKLNTVRHDFGEQFYQIILKMLELDQSERLNFQQLLNLLSSFKRRSSAFQSNISGASTIFNQSFRSPNAKKSSMFNNNKSPFRASEWRQNRTPQRITNRTPRKQGKTSFIQYQNKSPLKRDLRINTQFGKQNSFTSRGYSTNRSPNKPTLIRKSGVSPLSRR